MDRRHRQRWMLFNKLPQDDPGTGRWSVLHLCGCSSVGRARPRHGRGHEFETRHPLHFGCVHALRGHATGCWWPGMCAALGQATCSETPHPTGCSRLGTAEVDFQSRRVRPETPVQEALVELTLRGWKTAATIGRRRNPSPDGLFASSTQRPECRPVWPEAAGSPLPSTSITAVKGGRPCTTHTTASCCNSTSRARRRRGSRSSMRPFAWPRARWRGSMAMARWPRCVVASTSRAGASRSSTCFRSSRCAVPRRSTCSTWYRPLAN